MSTVLDSLEAQLARLQNEPLRKALDAALAATPREAQVAPSRWPDEEAVTYSAAEIEAAQEALDNIPAHARWWDTRAAEDINTVISDLQLVPKGPVCDHAWTRIADWYGDPNLINGTADCSFWRCLTCGDESSEQPPDYDAGDAEADAHEGYCRRHGIDP